MCIQNNIQTKIAELTDNGDEIVRFLIETLRGNDPTVSLHHRLEAARLLGKYGIQLHDTAAPAGTAPPDPDADSAEGSAQPLEATPAEAESRDDETQAATSASPVALRPTLRDIVAYPVARYIRERTADGETIVATLCDIMHGGDYEPYAAFGTDYVRKAAKPHEQLGAAKEILRRAFGESAPTRRTSAPATDLIEGFDEQDPVNSRIARLVREKTNNGIDAAELIVRIMDGSISELGCLPGHRLAASRELIHRGYDLNYDAVTWQHIEAYNHAIYPVDNKVELQRARHQAQVSALLREYGEACKSGDEEAMAAAEKKYTDFVSRRSAPDPDEPVEYAGYGPADPDPTVDSFYTPPARERRQDFDPDADRLYNEAREDGEQDGDQRDHDNDSRGGRDHRPYSAAATIPIPRLIIPITPESQPP